uniref:MATH domain-containing protein n=1 Tax=Mesocestoides corti TaxID=53468 RepID=A0A5K3EYM1_MESCO
MARSYPADTRSQKALEEIYEKESLAALKFFLSHRTSEKAVDKKTRFPHNQTLCLPKREPLTAVSESETRTVNEEPIATQNVSTTTSSLSFMRPVSPASQEILHGEQGQTKAYLKVRSSRIPEERYEIPVISSMEYGWKLFEILPKNQITHPQFGRSSVIRDHFYSGGRLSLKMGEDCL